MERWIILPLLEKCSKDEIAILLNQYGEKYLFDEHKDGNLFYDTMDRLAGYYDGLNY